LQQSAELLQILKQKPVRPAAYNMKRRAALIEPSELDWSEAKLSCYGRNSCAGIGVIARYEHGLPLPRQGRIRSQLFRRQMIERLHQACSGKCLRHNFRREQTSQLFRSRMKRIRNVDNDLAVPLLELLRNILYGRKMGRRERSSQP
jgi:hypothetical protein